jgi:hypothetical protein
MLRNPAKVFAVPKRAEVVGTRGAALSPLIRRHLKELIDWPRNGRVEIDFSGTRMEAYAREHCEWRGRGCGRRGVSVVTIRDRVKARDVFLKSVCSHQS